VICTNNQETRLSVKALLKRTVGRCDTVKSKSLITYGLLHLMQLHWPTSSLATGQSALEWPFVHQAGYYIALIKPILAEYGSNNQHALQRRDFFVNIIHLVK